jgi:hypothetical protein
VLVIDRLTERKGVNDCGLISCCCGVQQPDVSPSEGVVAADVALALNISIMLFVTWAWVLLVSAPCEGLRFLAGG